MQQLIPLYEALVADINKQLQSGEFEDIGDLLLTKKACYEKFISELKQLT